MKTRKILALILSLVMVLSLCGSAFAFYSQDELDAFGLDGYTPNEIAHDQVSRDIALESYVLMKNNGVLPIAKEGKIALFGNGATGTIKGGSGSGIVNQRERDWIDTAFEDAGYEITTPQAYRDAVGRGNVATGFSGDREARDVAITDEWLEEAKAADTAIYVLARTAGEGSDRRESGTGNGRWLLYDIERENIEKITKNFKNVIIVLNTYVTDVTWLKEIGNIDAVLHIGYGGQKTGITTLQVLNGTVTPSGKTNATWAWELNDYLSSQVGFSWMDNNTTTEYYSDGIYVGYRYFDTFGKVDEVAFPFGFGLSYTDFDIAVDDVTIDAENVTVKATVTNVGDTYSGKEVVQVYFSAPDGKLEKPYQELAAFAKTDELAPGEKQTLTITFATADMSSYDEEQAAYIMEPGEYVIRVGNCSRNTHVFAVGTLDKEIITEQLTNQFRLEEGAVLDEVSKEGATPITYDGEADEIANAPHIAIPAIETVDHSSPYDDETATTYLFAADAEEYTPRENITLSTKTVNGIIENAQNPEGPNFRGHMTTTYKEVVETVPELPEGMTKDTVKLTDVLNGKITLKQFVASLSVDEMANLVHATGQGSNVMGYIYDEEGNLVAYSHAMRSNMARSTALYFESRHIPVLAFTDGPAGIRCDREGRNQMICPQIRQPGDQGGTHFWSTDGGITDCAEGTEGAVKYSMYPTAFPGSTNIACTWNTECMYKMGEGVGKECREYNVNAWLAPGINIHRNPMCGRNFEYYSEDPYLSGISGAYTVAGVQASDGVGVTLKHYFGNNQENNRGSVNNVISERAIREIYMRGYEIAIKLSQPMYMMTSYNENNGWPSADNFDACTDLVRGEWNFHGAIMTDWGGGQSTPHVSMHAGNDFICPGKGAATITNYMGAKAPEFEESGYVKVTETVGRWGRITRTEEWGNFVLDAKGAESYTVKTNAASEEELLDSIKTAIANGTAVYDAQAGTVTYKGFHNGICLGDLQKAALNILNMMLYTQDLDILCDDLKLEHPDKYDNFSAAYEAPLAEGYTALEERGEAENAAVISAAKVEVTDEAAETASVPVTYRGEGELSSVRLAINSELPIVEIKSANDYEYNEENGKIVVYSVAGQPISADLFEVVVDVTGAERGEYPVTLELIEATGSDALLIDAVTADGAVIIAVPYPAGDVNMDGVVDNADLIMIARYLVELEVFDYDQMQLADYNDDGNVNNTDLVLIAKAIAKA